MIKNVLLSTLPLKLFRVIIVISVEPILLFHFQINVKVQRICQVGYVLQELKLKHEYFFVLLIYERDLKNIFQSFKVNK